MRNKGCLKLLGILSGALLIGIVAYIGILRPWHLRWGATDAELALTLPGDEYIASPERNVTRAITIEAPAEEVWGWVAQSGADTGGLYSYTWMEALVACPIVNADRIHPEWQHPQPGDVWPMCPDGAGPPPYEVVAVEPGRALILGHQENGGWFDTWAFVVQPVDAATTRLIHRSRTAVDLGWVKAIELPMFIMERGMLRGIRARAEGRPLDPSEEDLYRLLLGGLIAGYLLIRLRFQSRSRRSPAVTAAGAGLQIILLVLTTFATIPALVYPFSESLDGLHINLPMGVRLLGALIFLTGDGLFLATHRALGRNWSAQVQVQANHELVTTGPYRTIRHPMYAALFLIGIGMALLAANALVGLPFLIVFAALYFSRVQAEEALLLTRFGEAYRQYMQHTGRLLPKLGAHPSDTHQPARERR